MKASNRKGIGCGRLFGLLATLTLVVCLCACDEDIPAASSVSSAAASGTPAPESSTVSSQPPQTQEETAGYTMQVQVYDGSNICEIPTFTCNVQNSEIDRLNAQLESVMQFYQTGLNDGENYMQILLYPKTSQNYIQLVLTCAQYPLSGTDPEIMSYIYDRYNRCMVTLDDAFDLCGVSQQQMIEQIEKAIAASGDMRSYQIDGTKIQAFMLTDSGVRFFAYADATLHSAPDEVWRMLYIYDTASQVATVFDRYSLTYMDTLDAGQEPFWYEREEYQWHEQSENINGYSTDYLSYLLSQLYGDSAKQYTFAAANSAVIGNYVCKVFQCYKNSYPLGSLAFSIDGNTMFFKEASQTAYRCVQYQDTQLAFGQSVTAVPAGTAQGIPYEQVAYGKLTAEGQALYDTLYAKICAMEDFSYSENRELVLQVCDAIVRDHPQVTNFFLAEEVFSGEKVTGVQAKYVCTWNGSGEMEREQLKSAAAEFEAVCDRIVIDMPNGLTTYQKYLYLAQVLSVSTTYDYSMAGGSMITNPYGALMSGLSIAQGYAGAYQYLCQKAGLWCVTVTGTSGGITHFWNAVQLEDGTYYVDVCRSDESGFVGTPGWMNFFCLTQEEMLQEHTLQDMPGVSGSAFGRGARQAALAAAVASE